MTQEWKCPHCHHSNAGSMHFCPNCGAARLASAGPGGGAQKGQAQSRRRLLWVVAVGLWALGCLVLAAGGGLWLMRRDREGGPAPAEVAVVIEPAVLPTPSPTSPPSPAPAPTLTPTQPPAPPTPAAVKQPAGPTAEAAERESIAAVSDRIGSTGSSDSTGSEGIILFLSSRDHEPQTEAERQRFSGHREMELYAMKPDGTQQVRLSGGPGWGSETAYLAPYYLPGQVVISGRYVFDLPSGRIVEELSLEFEDAHSPNALLGHFPSWAPDGSLAFFDGGGGSSIYYVEDLSGDPRQLTDPSSEVWGDGWPCLSPDGKRIAFSRVWDDPEQDGLWLIGPDGHEEQRIIDVETRQVSWSPDGTRLAFEGPKANAAHFSFELWVSDADGGNARQLTTLPKDFSIWGPNWSPDGTRIVFQAGPDVRGHIYMIDAEGGEPRQLTTAGDLNASPLWLPLSLDGLQVASAVPAATPTPAPVVVAPTAPPATAPVCPSPGVQITSPRPGARFTQRSNYIVGTANIARFHHWKLEYSTNPNGGWTFLLERDYPVDNDKLAMIDAGTIPRGPYGLRLTVVDETGNYPEPCEVWFTNAY